MRSRIIGLILIKDGLAVQSINFKKFLPLGRVEILMEHLLRWGIDEITLLDITKDIEFKDRFYKNLRNITRNCNVPIAVGGGIKNIKNADFIFANGGDKIIINSEFFNRPKILNDLSLTLLIMINFSFSKKDLFNIFSFKILISFIISTSS